MNPFLLQWSYFTVFSPGQFSQIGTFGAGRSFVQPGLWPS
jgi:hypothetical protein